MRCLPVVGFGLLAAAAACAASPVRAANTVLAADMAIPEQPNTTRGFSVQKGPPNCSRWTDDCVTCTRPAGGEAPLCSNIGVSCQPKPVRCLAR